MLELTISDNLKKLAEEKEWFFQVISPAEIQYCYPSNTIEEDILYVIQHWADLLKLPPENRIQFGREEYFYHLCCATEYEVDEAFICEIPYATIINSTGLTITSDLNVIRQSIDHNKRKLDLDAQQIKHQLTDNPVNSGKYVSLLSCHSSNFAHWLMDSLPKLALIEALDEQLKKQFMFIIPDKLPQQMIDSLELLGIPSSQMIPLQEEGITVEKLILCHVAQHPGRPKKRHLLWVRNSLLARVIGTSHPTSSSRRIFLSRSKYSPRRSLVNENEILPILEKYDFTITYPETLSLAEQIRIFSEAEVVLGPHGAAFYSQIFCPSGTSIIEIYNKEYWFHSSRIVANFMGHTHWHVFGENMGDDLQTWIDPLKLEKVLLLALADKSGQN
jgi:capsular polysaccharide biosynthesis protein